MAVSRTTAWIFLLARLLAMAVLLTSVVFFVLANKLESMYVVASAVVGLAGSLQQIPAAIYLLCKSSEMTPRENNPRRSGAQLLSNIVRLPPSRPTPMPNVIILDISMYADIVMSLVLASGVGAGFGARRWEGSRWGIVALVFLLVGMLLCICATVVSVWLRARASNDHAAAAEPRAPQTGPLTMPRR